MAGTEDRQTRASRQNRVEAEIVVRVDSATAHARASITSSTSSWICWNDNVTIQQTASPSVPIASAEANGSGDPARDDDDGNDDLHPVASVVALSPPS